MERLNEVRIIGNVGKVRENDKVTYVAVALNESYKAQGASEWTNKTVWVDVVAFGPVIEKIKKAGIDVGDGVLVIGKLGTREYEDKKYTQVIAQKIQLVAKKGTSTPPEDTGAPENEPEDNDDLPF